MKIIEIKTLDNGAHRNQSGQFSSIPSGWAVIPDTLDTSNFPFGEVTAEEVNGVMTCTSWTPLPIPEPEPIPESEDTEAVVMETMLDHELRLSALELGV